jgi:hypothetical protein
MVGIFFLGTFGESKLNIENNFVNLVIVYYLKQKKFEFIKNTRINILVDSNEKKPMIDGLHAQVCTINFQRDLETYNSLKPTDKKKWQLDLAIEGLTELFMTLKKDVGLLVEIKTEIKKRLLTVDLPLFNGKFCEPGGDKKIMVRVKPDLHKNIFFLRYLDENSELISEINFFEGFPRYSYWRNIFKACEWTNENKFKILNSSRDFSTVINLKKGTTKFELESSMLTFDQVKKIMKDFSIENELWKKAIED